MRTRNAGKEKIVKQKAVELLMSEGFEGFSVNKLAKACGISVATLYIYYKDKDDLIYKVAAEELEKMNEQMLQDFDPSLSFADGLKVQWKNRATYLVENPDMMFFFEKLRASSYQEKLAAHSMKTFGAAMGKFMHNAVKNGEIDPMPVEVFWSIAYGPLYTLGRFNHEGRSIGGKPFTLTNKMLWQAFDIVLRALLKKNR